MAAVMLYDGECRFCGRSILWLSHWTGPLVHCVPFQVAAGRFPQIPEHDLRQAVHLVEADGRVTAGAHAILRAVALNHRLTGLLWLYERLPPFATLAEAVYGFAARHRACNSPVVPLPQQKCH